jgi:predicted nucleic acid-binding protein
MAFILDSSVALAWLLPDETNADTDSLADRLDQATARVPQIWPLEVGNALIMARRRGRITDAELDQCIAALSALPIEVDHPAGAERLAAVLKIARRHGLTSYDAAYVELAQRCGLPLATLDSRLRQVCKTLKVPVLP